MLGVTRLVFDKTLTIDSKDICFVNWESGYSKTICAQVSMQYGRLKITFSTHFAKASKMKLHAMSIDETKCKESPAIAILLHKHTL